MRLHRILAGISFSIILTIAFAAKSLHSALAQDARPTGSVVVVPQYDTTHVDVAPQDFDRFATSLIATFGGKITRQGTFTVSPKPSSTMSPLVLLPARTISVFGFKTPVRSPFGADHKGYRVTDLDAGALVAPADNPFGKDAMIDLNPRVEATLPQGVTASFDWIAQWSESRAEAVYNVTGFLVRGADGSHARF